ncbi:MAG: hypothetical protein SFX73_40335 [Kofleriaceae bacterium]|nr:hypothetical protein [Kofleriaceae bacterium]
MRATLLLAVLSLVGCKDGKGKERAPATEPTPTMPSAKPSDEAVAHTATPTPAPAASGSAAGSAAAPAAPTAWPTDPKAITERVLEVLRTGNYADLAQAPLATPMTAARKEGKKVLKFNFDSGARLAACLEASCKESTDELLRGSWEVDGPETESGRPAPKITCKSDVCTITEAVSLTDNAFIPTAIAFKDGKIAELRFTFESEP